MGGRHARGVRLKGVDRGGRRAAAAVREMPGWHIWILLILNMLFDALLLLQVDAIEYVRRPERLGLGAQPVKLPDDPNKVVKMGAWLHLWRPAPGAAGDWGRLGRGGLARRNWRISTW